MILPTMTPEEKVRQMEKMMPLLREAAMGWLKHNGKMVQRTKFFPTFYTFEREFEGMGKWAVVIVAESKSLVKRGILNVNGYQTYTITHSKNESNNGMGIYQLSGHGEENITCIEFPPHYFNQFRKRFVEARGLAQPDFPGLVKMVLREQSYGMDETVTSIEPKFLGDELFYFEDTDRIDRQSGFKNLISYTRNGLSLGLSGAGRRYFLFTTYISNEMLKDNQTEAQAENLRELLSMKYKEERHPFGPEQGRNVFIDPASRGYKPKNKE